MANNPGIYPLNPDSAVGSFRLASGDTQSVPFDPVKPGIQNYTFLSDDEILELLDMGADSINRAIGYWYLSLAGAAARQSKSVKDYDLQVDLTKRAADLRATAAIYFDRAAAEDEAAGLGDIFEIFPTTPEPDCPPELSARTIVHPGWYA